MNSLDTPAHSKFKRPLKIPAGPSGIQEEPKARDGADEELSTSDDVELSAMSDDEGLQDDEETGLTGKDRQRRKRRRRRNTLLDQRIASEVRLTAEVQKEADQSVVKNSLINVLLIGLWYLFSLSISIVSPFLPRPVLRSTNTVQYNKWMFDPKHLDFRFPLFTTCGHMVVQFCLSSLVLLFFPQFRPRYDAISNPHNAHSDLDRTQHNEESAKPLMTRMFYFTRIGPCGMATGLDIGLGNMSLKLITLTFYSSSPPCRFLK
jgi:solute carrier family 35 protein C2